MKARTYDDALLHCVVFAHAYDADGLPHVHRVIDGLATALAIVYGGEPGAIYAEIADGVVKRYEPIEPEEEA